MSKKREWVQRYPDYPDLLDGRLGDIEARFQRLDYWENGIHTLTDDATDEEFQEHLDDMALWWPSMLKRFIDRVDAGEAPEQWIMENLKKAFTRALSGVVWEDSIPLPGREFKDEWKTMSPKQIRDLSIARRVDIGSKYFGEAVTEAIDEAAKKHHVSFETARAAYYEWRNSKTTDENQKDSSGE